MRHQIEFLGFRFEIKAEKFKAIPGGSLIPVLVFGLLVLGLIFLFKGVPALILPALSVLLAIKLFALIRTLKIKKLNEFDSTSRPYVSEMKSEESVPIIDLHKLKKEERPK